MALTPSGPISTAINNVKTLLANVPEFQAVCGVDNATDAAKHIFTGESGNPILSIAISSGVMTVVLRDPVAVSVDQIVSIDGVSIGAQSLNLAGQYAVLSTDAAQGVWEDQLGQQWRDSNGVLWKYDLSEMSVIRLSASNQADLEATELNGMQLTPCKRPIVTIFPGSNPLKTNSVATGAAVIQSGTIDIIVECAVTPGYRNSQPDATTEAENTIGSIAQGLGGLQSINDYIPLNQIEITHAPNFGDVSQHNSNQHRFERWLAVIQVTWGLEG